MRERERERWGRAQLEGAKFLVHKMMQKNDGKKCEILLLWMVMWPSLHKSIFSLQIMNLQITEKPMSITISLLLGIYLLANQPNTVLQIEYQGMHVDFIINMLHCHHAQNVCIWCMVLIWNNLNYTKCAYILNETCVNNRHESLNICFICLNAIQLNKKCGCYGKFWKMHCCYDRGAVFETRHR